MNRSEAMRARAGKRVARSRLRTQARLVDADIRWLPSPDHAFPPVMAPYAILQSLLSGDHLRATLASVSRVLGPRGVFGMDLVADLPSWGEYKTCVRLRGGMSPGGRHLTLIESVRQDPGKGLTIFDQEYVETCGPERQRQRFSLAFLTVSVL